MNRFTFIYYILIRHTITDEHILQRHSCVHATLEINVIKVECLQQYLFHSVLLNTSATQQTGKHTQDRVTAYFFKMNTDKTHFSRWICTKRAERSHSTNNMFSDISSTGNHKTSLSNVTFTATLCYFLHLCHNKQTKH